MDTIDRRLGRLREALAARPRPVVQSAGAREAAVALVLRPGEDLELLLIRRAERSGDPWSGHMAFPGGTRRRDDASLLATAQRETEEETGVPLARSGTVLGSLDPVSPMTRRLPDIIIAPFVLTVPAGTRAQPDGREVVATMWAPLGALRDERAVGELIHTAGETRIPFATVEYEGHAIWGLTHRILTEFFGTLDAAGV